MVRTLLLSIFAFCIVTSADAADIYQIKGINVTVADSDIVKARQKALQDAEKKAFEELQKKLITSGYIHASKPLTIQQIESAVESVDIVSEKIGTKSYKASYNITFNSSDVSRIFNIVEIDQSDDPEKYLAIPMVVTNGQTKIWKNDWLTNWSGKRDDIVIPLGDLQDVQSLKEQDLANKKYDGLYRMQKRYAATAIALIKAEYKESSNSLSVELQRIKDQERTTVTYEYPGGSGITSLDLFDAAASDIIYRLETGKLTDNSVEVSTQAKPKLPDPYSPNAPGAGFIGEKKYPQTLLAVPPVPDSLPPTPHGTLNAPAALAPASTAQAEVPAIEPATPQAAKTEITVIAPDLIAWNRIRSKLIATQGITDLKIKSFSGGRASISVAHDADMSALVIPLSTKGLELTEDPTQGWQLREK